MTKTAWDNLLPQYRSEFRGWTTAGEFRCPYCDVMIGKPLKGPVPHMLATQHLMEAHNKTPRECQVP